MALLCSRRAALLPHCEKIQPAFSSCSAGHASQCVEPQWCAAPDTGVMQEILDSGLLSLVPALLQEGCTETQLATLWLCTNILHQ